MLENYPIHEINTDFLPKELLEIPEPPKRLFIRGTVPDESYIRLAVVGARRYTTYGKEVTQKLISGLRGYKITIVSGLALGIDSIAHEASLDANLPTIAIPGSGLDESVLHPRSNVSLAREIIMKGGAMISEMEPTEKATQWSFPRRNRIMAGISKAVLVIEAEKKSGTLITARLATEYNRDVFTVPGSIFSSNSEGPTLLLKLGATPITSSEDILDALNIKTETKPNQTLFDDLNNDERLVVNSLSAPLSREEILMTTKLTIQRLNMTLSLLELKGIIKESGGEIFLV